MLDRALIEKLRVYFDDHREEMVRDLCRLVRVPSVRSEPAPDAPFGISHKP